MGQLNQFLNDSSKVPTAQVHHRVGPGRLQQSQWAASQVGSDPCSCYRRADRIAAGRSGWTRAGPPSTGGRDGAGPANSDIARHFDLVGFDPPGGAFDPDAAMRTDAESPTPTREGADGRLQPGRCGTHRTALPWLRPAMRQPDGQGVLGDAVPRQSCATWTSSWALGDDQISYLARPRHRDGHRVLRAVQRPVGPWCSIGAVDPTRRSPVSRTSNK